MPFHNRLFHDRLQPPPRRGSRPHSAVAVERHNAAAAAPAARKYADSGRKKHTPGMLQFPRRDACAACLRHTIASRDYISACSEYDIQSLRPG
mmetsp:Transcript_10702/g.43296  ORF Transcript_10702/g.43296 Transcript_10702/m.43296 type:complete len:93 (+) Transcript_10702:590-868(+)